MSIKYTTQDFKEYVKNVTNGEYELHPESIYVNSSTKVNIIHHKCGNIYPVTPNVFKHGRRCPKCNGGIKSSLDEFKKTVYELVGNEYTVIGDYVNGQTKIELIHNTENPHSYFVTPTWFKAGSRCPYCRKLNKKTQEQFENEVYEQVKNEYTVLGNYINNKTKIKFRHNKCNRNFEMTPKDFLNKHLRCPLCKSSKGEEEISKILDKYNVQYERHYKNKDCKNSQILEFDFKIDYTDGSFCLIEYDGRLHFEPWKNNEKGIEHLKKQKENDEIKNKFCKENNIELFRISYLEFDNLESILCEKFNLY